MSRLLLPLVLFVIATGHADARPTHFFRPDARLDTSQVQDRRGQSCVYVGGGYFCESR